MLPASYKPVSPTPHLLTSDHVPSASEAALIDAALGTARLRKARMEAELQRTKLELEIIDSYIADHQALLAPVRRTPADVLAEIFMYCLPMIEVRGTHDPSVAPLLVSQVSRRWRSVALATPLLWSAIFVSSETKYLDHAAKSTELWLARSGTAPLSLTIHMGHNQNLDDCVRFLEVIMPYCERWEWVSFELPSHVHNHLEPIRGRLSSLVTLSLYNSDPTGFTGGSSDSGDDPSDSGVDPWDLPSPQVLSIYELAPQLVTMYGHFSPSNIKLPWVQLTSWYAERITCDFLLGLDYAPNLVTCDVDFHGYYEPWTTSPSPHHLLTSLSITSREVSEVVVNAVSLLTLPALRHFYIGGLRGYFHNGEFPSLATFLDRSPHLRILTLEIVLRESELFNILLHTPVLSELTIGLVMYYGHDYNNPCINDRLIRRLTCAVHPLDNGDDGFLLPNLAVLSLTLSSYHEEHSDLSAEAIVSMVQSRWHQASNGIARVESIHIQCHRGLVPRFSTHLESLALEKAGFRASVTELPRAYQ